MSKTEIIFPWNFSWLPYGCAFGGGALCNGLKLSITKTRTININYCTQHGFLMFHLMVKSETDIKRLFFICFSGFAPSKGSATCLKARINIKLVNRTDNEYKYHECFLNLVFSHNFFRCLLKCVRFNSTCLVLCNVKTFLRKLYKITGHKFINVSKTDLINKLN